jgi:glycosyltransferase involved in cell wall biosynthesis
MIAPSNVPPVARREAVKVAIVHDWLTGMRGGEKVLAELLALFPNADVFTLIWQRGSVASRIEARVKDVSFLDKLPSSCYRYYLPLFPTAIRSLDLRGYDLILSCSHAAAKSVKVPTGALHASYVLTPMRYLWGVKADYFQFGGGRWWKRLALALAAPWLRRFDRRTAGDIDLIIAASENVRGRIRTAWDAAAPVVYPPVDTDFFRPAREPVPPPENYYLAVSSLEPYKRLDLAIRAFSGRGRRLLVAGKGTMAHDLRAIAQPPVEFLGEVSDRRLRKLYRGCRALIFPGLEDFGLVVVEAQACGRPVVAFGEGGALETVVDGATGVFFPAQTPESLLGAVDRLESIAWNGEQIRRHSLRFSRQQFRSSLLACLEAKIPIASNACVP